LIKKIFRALLKIFGFGIPISLILVSTYLFLPEYYESFDNKIRDLFFKYRGYVKPKNKIIIVDIDEKSLDYFGQYPWDRTILASIIQKLTEAGAGVIGLDIMFPEEDRTSPYKFAKKFGLEGEFPDNDKIFAYIVSKTPTILGYTFNLDAKEFVERDTPLLPATFIEEGLNESNDFMIKANDVILNIPTIQDSAYSSGFFNNTPDSTGTIRAVPLVIKYDDEVFPSLAFEIVRAISGVDEVRIIYNINGIEGIAYGDKFIPTDRYGRLYLNYRGPGFTFKYISAVDIYKNEFDPEDIRNSVVIIGASASGLYDIRAIPFDNRYPGVEVHASVIDNLLTGDFLSKPAWVEGFDIVFIVAIVFGVTTLFVLLPANLVLVLLPFIAFGISHFIYYYLFEEGIMINTLFPFLALLLTKIVLTIVNLFFEQKQKKLIKSKFAAKVSPAVMEDLIKSGNSDIMIGHEREITVMFSDVRNFTNISESMPSAKVLIEFLNEYMNPMAEIITKHGGTIDKFIGDAIMAYWNAPLDIEDHPNKAVTATLEQLHACIPLNERIKKDPRFTNTVKMAERMGVEPIEIGLGLNTGVAVVGEMGSKGRSDYTAIGDPVNLGARLESLCKYYNSKCNISNFTKERLDESRYIFRFLDLVTVKGKTEPIEIWQVHDFVDGFEGRYLFSVSKERIMEELDIYHKAIKLYRDSKFQEALKIFEELESWKDKTNKNIYKIYIERCQHYIENPPENFDGVFRHTTKG